MLSESSTMFWPRCRYHSKADISRRTGAGSATLAMKAVIRRQRPGTVGVP